MKTSNAKAHYMKIHLERPHHKEYKLLESEEGNIENIYLK